MANVYAATHRNGAESRSKILHPQLAEDPSLCERFKREGYFANSIGHPGIVRAIDDDVTEDGCAFLVMELLEGETLERAPTSQGRQARRSAVLLASPTRSSTSSPPRTRARSSTATSSPTTSSSRRTAT